MEIKEQVLSIEQMKHLQELGVDTSDASTCWLDFEDNEPMEVAVFIPEVMLGYAQYKLYPTYTIGDLIEKLPKYFYAKENPIEMCAINGSGAFVVNYHNIANTYIMKDDTIKNALYKLLCWVAENRKELLEVKNE